MRPGRKTNDAYVRQGIGALAQRLRTRLPAPTGWKARCHVELPDVVTFADRWLRRPLYPGPQTEFARNVFGDDPLRWRGGSKYRRGYAKWGKRGGKDNTFAVIADYACAKMVNYLDICREFGLADGTPIAGINVSYNATQAREVFFKYLKSFMRRTINPATGRNFFESMGLDLREGGKCFQARRVVLSDRTANDGEDLLCFYSGDSREITGEGKNLLIALLDELGAFPSVGKAVALHDALVETSVATFGDDSFVGAASYVYARNDAMLTVWDQAEGEEKDGTVFRSSYPSWEANPKINRAALEGLRRKNPQRFARVYECRLSDSDNQFFRPSEEVRGQCNTARRAPTVGDRWWTDDVSVDWHHRSCALKFEDTFRGIPGVGYWMHLDLATGKDGRDKVGLALCRKWRERPRYSASFLKSLEAAGRPAAQGDDQPRDGLWVELMLQVRAMDGREVRFADLLDFAVWLRDVRGFNILGLSYDGWQSVGEQQRARGKGFNCVEISVDRDNGAAELVKELVYAGLLNYYPHPTFLREAEELVYDAKDKVDHPEASNLREQEEGDRRGSKDVWDAVCACGEGLLGGEQGAVQVDESQWMST